MLRRSATQIDDGWAGSGSDRARMDRYLNRTDVTDRQLVVWYGAHFRHAQDEPERSHRVGPTLRPFAGRRWFKIGAWHSRAPARKST